jgi:hypothetical protein
VNPLFKKKATQAMTETLTLSHGQMVVKDKFQAGEFVRSFNKRYGSNSYYAGTWKQLEALVTKHRDDFEPGTGSVDNDVILVNVPAEGFFTCIAEITPENAHLVRENTHSRQEGEQEVTTRVMDGVKPPAKFVQVVCYRADVLAQDDERTTNAEWEIIAVNAQLHKSTPMHPTTMLRNSNHDKGGTYREYTQEQWDEAYAFWDKHAYVQESEVE